MTISPSRIAAFDVLYHIETEQAFSSVLLPRFETPLSTKDRALCHEIVLGVLRRRIYLDKVIEQFAVKPKMDIEVRIALRIGIFQLLFLDKVPAYSAINESVNLVRRAKKTSAKGLVNAVLRRTQSEDADLEYSDELERISIETSHPKWLIEKWAAEFGVSETEALAKANNSAPRIDFRLTAKSNTSGLSPKVGWAKSENVSGCYFADRIDSELLQLAEKGDIYFQDEASQLVGGSVELDANTLFLDVCAAPGGKATQIALRFGEETELLAAGDLRWSRVKFLRDNCERQTAQVSVLQYDAERALPFADKTFEAVLVDAPCSGTGTIRHNPEIRYSLKPGDFAELSDKQLRILQNASKLVKPRGRIYYSTCSLETEENEGVISRFLKSDQDFRKVRPEKACRFATAGWFVRTYPHRDNMDGFFLAVLESTAKQA